MTEPREIAGRLRAWAEHERVESYVPSDATRQSDLTEAASLIEQLLDQEGVGEQLLEVADDLQGIAHLLEGGGAADDLRRHMQTLRGIAASCPATGGEDDPWCDECGGEMGCEKCLPRSATTEQASPDCETCGGSREGIEDGGVCPGCGTGVSARPSPSGQNETDENPGTGKAATTGEEGA